MSRDDDLPVRDKRLADLRVRDVPAALLYVGLRVVGFVVLGYCAVAAILGLLFAPLYAPSMSWSTLLLLAAAAIGLIMLGVLRSRALRRLRDV